MKSNAMNASNRKGIVVTFYTMLIALISMGLLIMILVLFIQKFFDIQLTIQESEQDRSVINLAQALLSSDKLVYVDSDSVVHRGVIDAGKTKSVSLSDLQNGFTYPNFYYTVIISDIDAQRKKNNADLKSPSFGETATLAGYIQNFQERKFPIAIRYSDGTVDDGVMIIDSGFKQVQPA